MTPLTLPGLKVYTGKYKCTRCGKKKKASEYGFIRRDGARFGTRKASCKLCESGRGKEWREKQARLLGVEEYKRRESERTYKAWMVDKTPDERRAIRYSWNHIEQRRLKAQSRRLTADRQARVKAIRKLNTNMIQEWEKNAGEEYAGSIVSIFKEMWAIPPTSNSIKYRLRYRYIKDFNVSERIRRQITKSTKIIDASNYIRVAIKRGHKSRTIERTLGYSVNDLVNHIKDKFTDGMGWDAFLNGDIHIDHIKPQRLFDMTDEEQFKECWSLDNLQPLWARDNLVKSGKYL